MPESGPSFWQAPSHRRRKAACGDPALGAVLGFSRWSGRPSHKVKTYRQTPPNGATAARGTRSGGKLSFLIENASFAMPTRENGDFLRARPRVDVQRGECWDYPSSTLVRTYGHVKVALTGEPPRR